MTWAWSGRRGGHSVWGSEIALAHEDRHRIGQTISQFKLAQAALLSLGKETLFLKQGFRQALKAVVAGHVVR